MKKTILALALLCCATMINAQTSNIISSKLIRCSSETITLPPNGGELNISCTFTSAVDRTALNSLIQQYHHYTQGVSCYRLSIVSFNAGTGCVFRVEVVPNYYNSSTRTLNTNFIFSNSGQQVLMKQEPGIIEKHNVFLQSADDNYMNGVIAIDKTQWDVRYALIREHKGIVELVEQKYGTGGSLSFRVTGSFMSPAEGIYYMRARHVANEQNIGVDELMLGQAVMYKDGGQVKTPYRNYISVKNITGNMDSYTDFVTYFDGLGYEMQTVQVEQASDRKNLITPFLYDNMRRPDAKALLPYARNDRSGKMDDYPVDNQKQYYLGRTDLQGADSAYTRNVYDKSGMNRIMKSYNAGNIFYNNNKYKEFRYETNIAGEVIKFSYEQSAGIIKGGGYYAAGKLFRNTTIDEDGNSTQVFTNTAGEVILERRFPTSSQKADTYYVYDDYTGLLSVVIPPEASAAISSTTQLTQNSAVVSNFCFTYKYGSRGRLIERKIPGKDVEYIVYDKGDRPVMSQDGNSRAQGKWFITEYDQHRRPIKERIIDCAYTRAVLQGMFDNGTAGSLYNSGILLAEYKYDSYSGIPSYLQAPAEYSTDYNDRIDQRTKNEKVYEKIAVLSGDSYTQSGYIERAYYYNLHRPIIIMEKNHLGGISEYRNGYDYQDNLLWTRESHQKGAGQPADVIETKFAFDTRMRVVSDTTTLNGGDKAIMNYQYDDLGRIRTKRYGNSNNSGFLANDNHEYNIQGWLTARWSQVTRSYYRYYDPVKGNNASYTGNISEIAVWPDQAKGYTNAYYYDGLNRLVDTRYHGNDNVQDKFAERDLSYDLNGNIKTLKRYGHTGGLEDNFSYTYNGNQLTALSGDGVEVTALDFPRSGYAEYNNWAVNNSIHTSRALIQTPSNGFGGAYNRFEVVSTGTLNLSIYNTYLHHVYLPRKDVIITVEYRSNYDLLDSNTGKVVLPAHTGNARTVSFCLEGTYHSIWNGSASPGSWLEIRTIKMEHRATPMDFPRSGYAEYNNWAVNNSIHTSRALIQTPSNGFGGAYNRFEVVSTGTLNLSIYNTYLHHVYLPRKDVIITVEYRSNYDLLDSNTGKVVLPAHTGNARTVSFCLEGTYHSIWNGSASPGSWLEIRTVKMEHRATPMDFPCEGFSEENNWGTNHAIYTSKAIKQTPANGFSGAYSRFEAIPGGTLRPSIYNSYIASKSLRYTPLVITIEYRSNYPLSEKATGGKILIPANTGNAKRVSFSFDDTSFSLLTSVAAADAWMEIRTIKIEKKNTEGGSVYHYAYDANGNMTRDGYRDMTLGYNYLNLIGNVKKGGVTMANYKWLADGTKAGVEGFDASGRRSDGFEYLGSLVYVRQNEQLTLESGSFSHGRIVRSQTQTGVLYKPQYVVGDHLGSTRHFFTFDPLVFKGMDYYSSGKLQEGPDVELTTQRWQYNGKEKQITGGVGLLDYGARMYDPDLMRWPSIDPLAEKYYGISPYAYVSNNPMLFIDPNGAEIELYELARYKNQLPKYHYSQVVDDDREEDRRGYSITSYHDKEGNIVGYGASRNGRLEYVMDDPNDLVIFERNIWNYSLRASFFYANGTPSEGMIKLLAGDSGKGLGQLWKEAFKDPGYYVYWTHVAGAAAMNLPKGGRPAMNPNSYHVTSDGVVLRKGDLIPSSLMDSPYRNGAYGYMSNGSFKEVIRIDAGTSVGHKGPSHSHYHLERKKAHYTKDWPYKK